MVAYSKRTISIVAASVIALVFIGIAFIISGPLPFHIGVANAASTHDLLVSYAAKDSDNDGLPDWEEALYGTDPNNPHSVSPTLTDGQAVAQGLIQPKIATATTTADTDASAIPGPSVASTTLTDQFARALFGQYLSTRGATTPTPDDIATFVEQGVSQLEQSNQIPDAYNAGEEHVVGQGPDALITYAAQAEAVSEKNAPQKSENEVDYFSDAAEKGDTGALANLKTIGTYYTTVAGTFIKVPVPAEAATAHLAVANAFARLGGDITSMSMLTSDPLRAYLGLAAYQNDAPALVEALTNLDAVFHNEGVSVAAGTNGAAFFAVLENAAQVAPQLQKATQ